MSSLTAKQKLVLLLVVSGDQNRKPFKRIRGQTARRRTLHDLERAGLVWRTEHPTDGDQWWYPTDLGRRVYDELMAPEAP